MKGEMVLEDNQIVRLFLKRDETAIKQTSEKYGKRLINISYNIVNDIQTAKECENDTYLEAWERIPPHEPYDYLYAFLARIIRNISLNLCRSKNRLKRSAYIIELSKELEQCISGTDDVESKIDEMFLVEALNGFLDSIEPDKRNIFMRRYWFMDSIKEIAKRYDMSESKVKIILYRSRNKLRDYLKKEGYIS